MINGLEKQSSETRPALPVGGESARLGLPPPSSSAAVIPPPPSSAAPLVVDEAPGDVAPIPIAPDPVVVIPAPTTSTALSLPDEALSDVTHLPEMSSHGSDALPSETDAESAPALPPVDRAAELAGAGKYLLPLAPFSSDAKGRETLNTAIQRTREIELPPLVDEVFGSLMVRRAYMALSSEFKGMVLEVELTTPVKAVVRLSIAKEKNVWDFGGELILSRSGKPPMIFTLDFQKGNGSGSFLGAADNIDLKVEDLVEELVAQCSKDLNVSKPDLPYPDVTVTGLFVVCQKKQNVTSWSFVAQFAVGAAKKEMDFYFASQPGQHLFGLRATTAIKFSDLPLVGKFDELKDVALENLGLIYASHPGSYAVPTLRDRKLVEAKEPLTFTESGFFPSVRLQLPDDSAPLMWPAAKPAGDTGKQAASDSSSPLKWIGVNKTLGPVTLEKIGLGYQDGQATLAISASFTLAGVTLGLQGLKISTSFTEFAPIFGLDGLGLDVSRGPLEIGGAFLHSGDDYAGTAVIRTETFALTAIGGYRDFHGEASLFLYAFLDYPLGGPAFFFVEGLAAGFGINRRFIAPPIDKISEFPLIAEAMSSPSPDKPKPDLATELGNLLPYLTPEAGENFLAVGVKFNSFKQIDSFVLVTVSFGRKLMLDVLGLSTMQVPAAVPGEGDAVKPLAFVQMALKAHFDPQEGFLSVQAQLTDQSYILAEACRLQGGFAFFSWFGGEHAGDFVATLGGYNPHFAVPAHYPQPAQVPRLGINWKVDSHTTIKGSEYYALTPSAVMAGGSLEANWQDGNLRAWFTLGVDFLMQWKPFHYQADAHVEIGASVTIHFFGTHHLTVSAGADLSIWGPEFAGIAHVHLKVMGIKVNFTTSFGQGPNTPPPPIKWTEFQKTFLPEPKDVCTLRATHGVIRTIEDRWIINAKDLCVVTDSAIPGTTGIGADKTSSGAVSVPALGIKPMSKTDKQFSSTITIEIKREDNNAWGSFVAFPIFKKVPTALWSSSAKRSDPNLVEALAGYAIHPATPPTPGASKYIQDGSLQYEVTAPRLRPDTPGAVTYTVNEKAANREGALKSLSDAITNKDRSKRRNNLLNELFPDAFPSNTDSNALDDPKLVSAFAAPPFQFPYDPPK